jgi:glycosyltransferase involved in cell wall biosynthesis
MPKIIMRLAIVITHPIQYYAPVFKALAHQLEIMVFYTWGEASVSKHDPGFGKTITWDIDLLEGYPYHWVNNTATDAGSHHFNGINNPDLIGQINAWQPDTILVYGWAYKSHLKLIRHFKTKIPLLFRGDSTLLDEKRGLKNLLRSIYLRWLYKHIDYALYTGANNKAYFKKYGLSEKQLVFAPHAIDNERFAKAMPGEALNLRQRLSIGVDAIVILFAGKLEEKKAPDLLLASFIKLVRPDVHLLFVGSGNLQGGLQKQANHHSNIHFMDFQNQTYMPVVYQACDIFCLPSRGPGETWGLAVNEAMACGKAILVSDKVGCATDLVKQGFNGFIHKANSVSDMAGKLGMLLNCKKEGLKIMGQQSAQIIKNWSIAVQVNNIVNYKNGY